MLEAHGRLERRRSYLWSHAEAATSAVVDAFTSETRRPARARRTAHSRGEPPAPSGPPSRGQKAVRELASENPSADAAPNARPSRGSRNRPPHTQKQSAPA